MFLLRLLLSLAELGLMILLSGLIIALIYRVFLRANPDFDMEEEIRRGNVAVGALMATIMVCAALLIVKGISASVGNLRLGITAPSELALPLWKSGLLVLGHLTLSLAIGVVAISVTLRLFGQMTRRINPEMQLGRLLKNGNLAVGLLLCAVVFITTLYVSEGVSSLTRSLLPQPSIGKIRIME